MEKITENLLTWYQDKKRDLPWRNTKDPYYIWISEIMLQQTRVEAVKVYYDRFITTLKTLKDLASASEDQLLKLWQGLGYYSRVRNMQKAAKLLIEEGYTNLPCDRDKLLSLPGIGLYTVGAILSIAFDIPSIAIDGNVYRILGRYYMILESISRRSTYYVYASYLEKILPSIKSGDFTQSFMDLGSMICTPFHPKCDLCPLKEDCLARRNNQIENYPVKEKKKKQKVEKRIVYLFIYQGKVAIRKRENKGLLASLYEFPNDLKTSSFQIEKYLEKIPYKKVREIGSSKHIFSHVIWEMEGYFIEVKEVMEEYIWVKKEELLNIYSIPSAFSYYYDFYMQNSK